MIVLDNTILIEIEQENRAVIKRLLELRGRHPETPAITAPVYAEFLEGFLSIGKGPKAEDYVKNFEIIPFDKISASLFAQLKIDLAKKGTPIPIFDLMTASIAIANNATLASADRHFERVPGIRLILLQG